MRVATYAVKAGNGLVIPIPLEHFIDSHYFIEVHAPNGFYRMFTGRDGSSPIQQRLAYDHVDGKSTGNLLLHLRNVSDAPAEVSISDNAYTSPAVNRSIDPHQEISILIPLERSQCWYDFTVTTNGAEASARFAGHVETGDPSVSDPKMGRVI